MTSNRKENNYNFKIFYKPKKTHSRPEIWKKNPLCKMCFPTSMTQATYVISISSHNQHYNRVLVNSDITTDTYDVFYFILVEYIWLTYPQKIKFSQLEEEEKSITYIYEHFFNPVCIISFDRRYVIPWKFMNIGFKYNNDIKRKSSTYIFNI